MHCDMATAGQYNVGSLPCWTGPSQLCVQQSHAIGGLENLLLSNQTWVSLLYMAYIHEELNSVRYVLITNAAEPSLLLPPPPPSLSTSVEVCSWDSIPKSD